MARVELRDVSKVYPPDLVAVEPLDLDVEDGEFMTLVGPSGCGKSTLLRVIAGLEAPAQGTIMVGERDVTALPPQARDVAMVFQSYALYPQMTARQNIAFPLKVQRLPRAEIHRRVEEAAGALGIQGLLDRKPGQLSGGERQRVAMGRAMVRAPRAFLMDEPLSNLDAKLRVEMRTELARRHRELGITTLYVTHDQVEAMTLGDRVAVMRDGHLLQCDTPRSLFDRPASVFVGTFIGSPAMNLTIGSIEAGSIRLAGIDLPLREGEARGQRDGEVIVGIRPAAFRVAGPEVDPRSARLRVVPEVVEELGTETHIVFTVQAPAVDEVGLGLSSNGSAAATVQMTAALDATHQLAVDRPVELALERHHVHVFDPASGRSLAGDP